MYRHRKTDLVKKEELIPDSEKQETNHHQVLEKEGASHKLRNSRLANMEATCNKKTGVVKGNNAGNTVPHWELRANISGTRQRSNNSACDDTADRVETLGGAPAVGLSVKDEDAIDTSTLRRLIETSTLSKYLNVPCPRTEQTRSGATAAKSKPNISTRRDPNMLPKQTEAEESVRNATDSTSVSKLRNSSLSTDRKNHISHKYHKEDVQECKKTAAGCGIPSIKSRSIKDVSARPPVQSKSLCRSRSPGLVTEQQSQQVSSRDRSRKGFNSVNPEVVCSKKSQQLWKDISHGSKSTHACVQFSKSKREQRGDDDSKDATYGIDSSVTRADDVDSNRDNLKGNGETQLQSPTSVTSSMSDTNVCDPKDHRTQSIGRFRQNGTDQSKSAKRRDVPAGLIKKAKFVGTVDAHDKSDNTNHLSHAHKRGFSRENVKPEISTTDCKAKKEIGETCRHQPLSDSVVAPQQITRDRTGVSCVKWNASRNHVNTNVYNNKFNISTKKEDGLCNASAGENKQNIKGPAKLVTKCPTTTSNQPSLLRNISETSDRKSTAFAKTEQRTDNREYEISDCKNIDRSHKEDKKTERVSTNPEARRNETSSQSEILPKLVSLEELVQSASTANMFCPCSTDDLLHISGFRPDSTQADILPVIYFCWQKCPNLENEDAPAKPNLQQGVSLEQGLNVFKQMMKEAISENNVYSEDFTLNQLNPRYAKSLPNCGDKYNNDELIVAGTCFQLKPSYKTKSNQVVLSSDCTRSSALQGSFNADGNHLPQENGQTLLLEKNGDNCYQLYSTVGEPVCSNNDLQTAINISKAIKDSIQRRLSVTSLWSFVSNGIIAFFVHPLETPSLASSDQCGENTDINGTNVDQINTVLDTGSVRTVGAPQQQKNSGTVESLQHATHVVDKIPAGLGQDVTEGTELSCQNCVPVKVYSERKRTHSFETSSKCEVEHLNSDSTGKSKSVPFRNKKKNVKDGLYIRLENSDVGSGYGFSNDHMSRLTEEMEMFEQELQILERAPIFSNTHASSNHEVEHRRLEKCRKDVALGEYFRLSNRSRDTSPFIPSNACILRGMHFEKTDRNEMNNIPFSTRMYQSLEGSQKISNYGTVFGQREDLAYRTFENDELEFVAPYEDCPDPGIEDLEKTTYSDLTLGLSGYCTAHLKQFPHLVWTWRCGQSMLDSEGQPCSESKGYTCCERSDVKEGDWRPIKKEESTYNDSHDDCVHFIRCNGYTQQDGLSDRDAFEKGVNYSLSAESPHCDWCHTSSPQTSASLTKDISTKGINARATRQNIISSHISKVTGICGIVRRQSSFSANSKMCYCPSTNEGVTLSNYVADAHLLAYGSSCNLMETVTMLDNNMQNIRVTSPDHDTPNGLDYRDVSQREDEQNKDIEEEWHWVGERAASSAGGITRERSNHYISAIHSYDWNPAYTSDHKVAPIVNMPTTGSSSSNLATINVKSSFDQNSSEVAFFNNDKHEHRSKSPVTQDSRYKTGEKMDGKMVSFSNQSEQGTSTGDDVNIVTGGSLPLSTTTEHNLQLFSTDNITRAALALKEVGSSHLSYLYTSQTASVFAYLLGVGCSRPLGATISNFIFNQPLTRDMQRRMLDQCGSSVDDGELSDTSVEDTHKYTLKDSLEHGKMDTGVWESIDSSQVGNAHKTEPEKNRKLSITQMSNNFPEVTNLKGRNRKDEEVDTHKEVTSFGETNQPGNIRSNNLFQKEGNKRKASKLHLPSNTDNPNLNECQSDQRQESGTFSYSFYSLASPPVTQPTGN